MLRSNPIVVLALVIACIAASPLSAQKRGGRKAKPAPAAPEAEVVRLMYDFSAGEAVTYRVVMRDTLLLNGANQLLQTAAREYYIEFRCDSIVRDGFAMTMRCLQYESRDRRDTMPTVLRTSHPWFNRPLSYVLRYDGVRARPLSQIDTPATAPGGPFQPMLLPHLGEPRARVGVSSTANAAYTMLENAWPAIIWTGSVFRTVDRHPDTLGVANVEIGFAETGRAAYSPPRGGATDAVINASSRHWFSIERGYPVAGEMHAINRLTIKTPRGDAEGRQSVTVSYQMLGEVEVASPSATPDAQR